LRHQITESKVSGRTSNTGAIGRQLLLAGLPVHQRLLDLAGVSTAVLEGGEGPPLILLHGPGESGVNWRRVIPNLVATYRVIAPDLPAHGVSGVPEGPLDAERMLSWLSELIEHTCPSPPALVGHVLGGTVGARFAIAQGKQLNRLVLVDSLGLARFRPSPRFLLTMALFLARPSKPTYSHFMRQCAFDLDSLREEMGESWEAFVSYNLELARAPKARAAGRLFRRVGLPRIPSEELALINVPTFLIWGRHDRAIRLRVAQAASDRYRWPLYVIENSADDPARDQPEAFVHALRAALSHS
jgi:pimeloyl-ACP methyl ester carboxylesterase